MLGFCYTSIPLGPDAAFFPQDVVLYLIDHGADGRIHPVTKYSPLYIAAYNGKKDIVEILLKRFPELVNTLTVEKWLVFV